MKKKNMMALAVAAALGLGVLPPAADAVSTRDIEQKRGEIDALRSKRSEVQEKLSEAQKTSKPFSRSKNKSPTILKS